MILNNVLITWYKRTWQKSAKYYVHTETLAIQNLHMHPKFHKHEKVILKILLYV